MRSDNAKVEMMTALLDNGSVSFRTYKEGKEFRLVSSTQHLFWVENERGEGMEIKVSNFFDMLKKHWDENF